MVVRKGIDIRDRHLSPIMNTTAANSHNARAVAIALRVYKAGMPRNRQQRRSDEARDRKERGHDKP